MFSKNGQISMRQTFRLFTYDLIGISTLLLPTFLVRGAGTDGFFCILLGSFLGILYISLLGWCIKRMEGDVLEYLKQEISSFFQKLILLFFLVHSVLLSGYCAYTFSGLMLKSLIREESFWLILALVLVIAGYGIIGGIEGRARIYEVVFWFILIPLIIMLVCALPEVDVDRWMPIADSSVMALADGSYLVFLFSTTVFWMLFFPKFISAENQGKALVLCVKRAFILSAVILAALYLILLGAFGKNALATMEFPAVTLMSMVQITGGFLKRTDAFMLGIWFFTLFAFLNTHLFYGSKMLKEMVGKQGNKRYMLCLLVLTFLVSSAFYLFQGAERLFYQYFRYTGVPLLVMLPVIFGIRGRRKKHVKENGSNIKTNGF